MSKTYAICWKGTKNAVQQFFITLFLVAGVTQFASANFAFNGGETGYSPFNPFEIEYVAAEKNSTNFTTFIAPSLNCASGAYSWSQTINATSGAPSTVRLICSSKLTHDITASLPAAFASGVTINITNAVSYDGYTGRNTVSQANERWRLKFFKGTTLVHTTPYTNDVPDNVLQGSWSGSLGTASLANGFDKITIEHWAVANDASCGTSPNSVVPVGFCITYAPISPCASQGGDTDGDGVCNNLDCAPTNPALPAAVGSACNDNNANTTNDVIQAGGCTCAGTPVTPTVNCNGIGIVAGNGSITVNGVTGAPVISIQVFDASWNTVYNQFFTNSPGSVTIPNLAGGTYYTKVQFLSAAWAELCKKEQFIAVQGAAVAPTISISDVTVNENAGTASLQICASVASTTPITVTYTTSNGTAVSSSDFTTKTGTATIAAGQTCTTVTFQITDDSGVESTEAFNVTLSGPAGATIADGTGVVTILDNDTTVAPPPTVNCDIVTYTAANGAITIGNLSNSGGITMIQAFDPTWNTVFNQYYTTTPASVTIPNLTGGNYWVKVQYLTSGWTEICKKEASVTVGGTTSGCNNVTNGGSIGVNQTICPGATPAMLTSVTAPSGGGTGAIEYLWLSSTTSCPTAISQAIPGASSATYTPGALTQTTYFVRCSRRAGCTDWTAGESNCVTVTVSSTGCNPTPTANCSNISLTGGNGSITVGNLSNSGGITMIQAFDASWNTVFNQYYTTTPASVTIPNLTGGNYWVKAQYLTSAWSEICKKEADVAVQGTTATLPTLTISDVTVNENAGTASLQICASAASSSPITVVYSTTPNTALAGTDYVTKSATATIPAGQTCVTVTFNIVDDTATEPTEVFHVYLSNPTGATIADLEGLVTIVDNDTTTPQFNCSTASTVVSGSNIVVSNLANAPVIIIQVADPSWNQTFNQWYTTNPGTVTIPTTVSGTYYVKVQYLTSAWVEICKKEVYLAVVGAPTGVLTFPQPGNITQTAPTGATSKVVTYPTPTATSTCTIGSVTLTRISGPASGSSFPVGTTQVCYRATDGCGNTQERCFNVIVNAPAGPVCNVSRTVTSTTLRNEDCTMNTTQYGMWFNVHFPGTTSNYYTISNATFVENANGTALLTAVATNSQNTNVKFDVSTTFCGRTYVAPNGSPKAPCFTHSATGWYYYTTTCGTLTGTNAAAGTVIQLTRRGEAFQVGTGANLNQNVFGASGWFNAYVTSGSVTGLTEGDFNFNLSGTPTAPACGTGTANCSTVACYTPPTGSGFPNTTLCYSIKNRETGKALDSDNYSSLTQKTLDGSSSQSWKFVASGEANYFYIVSNSTNYNGQAIGLANCSTADGALAHIGALQSSDCQKFRLQDAGSGFYYIVNKVSGKALKLWGNDIWAENAPVAQLPIDANNQHQKWEINQVSCTYNQVAQTAAVSLSAERQGNAVSLRWLSNTGKQNASYQVERSTNGVDFTVIATGSAASQEEIVYFNEVDNAPAKAENIYRVRMLLNNGVDHVSNEQKVFMPEVGSFGLYPNPATEIVTLDASDFVGQAITVQMFNQLGKLVKTVEVAAGTGLIELELTDLNSGFYGISIESNGVKRSAKLVVAQK